jgi:hypothetical protein
LIELGQVRVALEQRGELELVLVPGVVEVVLLVQFCDEAVGPVAEAVEVGGCEWGSGARDGPSGAACADASRTRGLRSCVRRN